MVESETSLTPSKSGVKAQTQTHKLLNANLNNQAVLRGTGGPQNTEDRKVAGSAKYKQSQTV